MVCLRTENAGKRGVKKGPRDSTGLSQIRNTLLFNESSPEKKKRSIVVRGQSITCGGNSKKFPILLKDSRTIEGGGLGKKGRSPRKCELLQSYERGKTLGRPQLVFVE